MEITVSSRHTEVSESLRAAAEEKIGRLSRFLEGMDRAEVHFFEERNPRISDKDVCEVTMVGHGHHVRTKVAAPDGFVAVDRAVEKLEHQLHKLKTRLLRRQQAGGRRGNGASATAASAGLVDRDADPQGAGDDSQDDSPPIVKTKRFAAKPMMPEEAALQMDMLGHDFFLFTNAETDRAAVIYRRADGDLGLIDETG